MNTRELKTASKYLKKEDLESEVTLTIKDVVKQNVALSGTKPDLKGVMSFEEEEYKPMVLNPTNVKRIETIYGTETEAWIGKKLIVFNDENVEYNGSFGGLRVKPPKKPTTGGVKPMFKQAEEEETPF